MSIGKVTTEFCPLSGIPVAVGIGCSRENNRCHKCGWNPKVNEKRREELHQLAAEGRVKEWGKT